MSRHVFKTNIRSCQLQSLGRNLFSNFASSSNTKENEMSRTSKQKPSPVQENIVSGAGSSSNVSTATATSRPGRGRPKNRYGIPNMARNLTRKFPIPPADGNATANLYLGTNTQNSNPNVIIEVPALADQQPCHLNHTSYSRTKPRCATVPKPSRGGPRKQLPDPILPLGLNRELNIHTMSLAQSTANVTPRARNVFTTEAPVVEIGMERNHPVNNKVSSVSQSTNNHHRRTETTCPIFTPTTNMDFNSDSDNDSDYDPFADDNCSESDEYEAPFSINDNATRYSEEYYDIGSPLIECSYCKAMMWYQERMHKSTHSANPKFMMCCGNGKVELPILRNPPEQLAKLLFDHDNTVSRKFQQHIRLYNMMFAFTSPGAKFDNRFNDGRGPPTMRIQGQTCHRIRSLLPPQGGKPKFAQLYIYDTENEVENRMHGLRNKENIDPAVVNQLSSMLYECNPHAKRFQMARQWLNSGETQNLKLRLISSRSTDG
ncbi:uncharacterized protein LOC131601360 [Vicia villosa]|uniref:uncharacterized protein LOC131601360 n=1 Tax=Vicia villosa TaxID=3911 RepID=UPI00273C9A86|nr:uncharacterized protein LOC131601360 [Vicia villosa]XP_058729138.1 uncharacterized protein LOC131601360 [Vicia villosa]